MEDGMMFGLEPMTMDDALKLMVAQLAAVFLMVAIAIAV